MRIVCPSCSAAYEVPDRLLGTGKKLRCARCSHEWVPAELPEPAAPPPQIAPMPAIRPPAPPVAAPPAPEPVLHAEGKSPRATRQPGGGVSVALALAASVLMLATLFAAAYLWRTELMQVWSPSRRLFGWLGIG